MKATLEARCKFAEILARLTILEIKKERIGDVLKRSHVELEYPRLQAVFDTQVEPSEALQELHNALREVNLRLWDIEDDIRDCERRKDFGSSFIELARSVYLTNDRRTEVKRAINALMDSALIEEKSYRAY
jgi:hypothetical protein